MIQVRPDDEMILTLEKKLQASLFQVQPNPDFVSRLGRRLANPSGIVLEQRSKVAGLLIISLGLVVGVILLWIFFPKKD